MKAITLGDMQIIALTDYVGPFAPYADVFPEITPEQWDPYRQRYPEAFAPDGMWRASFNCYLVRAGGQTILVDTGLGPEADGFYGALMDELHAAGVAPSDITTVVFTHMHSDHIGWNLSDERAPLFPNARFAFDRGAWEAVLRAGEADTEGGYAAQVADQLRRLQAHGVVDLLAPGATVGAACMSVATDGHAPGHISLRIESGGQRALIVGDVLLHPAQVSEPEWASSYDEDPDLARQSRRALLDQAESEGLLLAVSHIPTTGFGRVVREGGTRVWRADEA